MATMRCGVVAISLLIAGCTAVPTQPAIKSAADLAPLGPCPASSWKPEAPPPTASAKTSMVLLAVGEWARFGRQVIVYSTDQPPRTEQLGVKERDAPERIADYWASVGRPERSGLDDVPWSAAFISWDIANAGVPRSLFCPDARHTIYVERLVVRARSRARPSSRAGPPRGRPRSATLYAQRVKAAAPPSTT